jgi:broad specificity phosphatase PhoE
LSDKDLKNSITLIVVRHGESDANKKGVISDKNIDHELTATGIQQAQETAEYLKNEQFDLVLTSTRQRARLTAEIVNEYHGATIIERDDLIERDFGVIGGISQSDAVAKMEKEGFNWIDIPRSEKAEEIDVRVGVVLKFLRKNYANKIILVSTHSDIVKSFHRVINGVSVEKSMSIQIGNSEPHYFSYT